MSTFMRFCARGRALTARAGPVVQEGMAKTDPRAAALKDNIARRKAQAAERAEARSLPGPGEELAAPGLLPDVQIRVLARGQGMIEPFEEAQQRGGGAISWGLSSYGYDARAAREFKIFTNVDNAIVDPKDFSRQSFVDREADVCVIPPNSFALTRTVEYFRIPADVLVVCLGKSTYARCGLIVNVTPLEPGWEGHVTLEISNTTPLPARVYAGEGIAQFLFFRGAGPCETSYADRAGKYMGQRGVTLPRL